jgi:hypothetical protein
MARGIASGNSTFGPSFGTQGNLNYSEQHGQLLTSSLFFEGLTVEWVTRSHSWFSMAKA